ncbi:MAG TPA: ATP-binding protein [Gaiellaceae bacterium]|nr:ATP-binding protein [Gaiellaceae bacterium]
MERADGRPQLVVSATTGGAARLEAAHRRLLEDAEPRVHRYLKAAHRGALSAFTGAGSSDAADRVATGIYVASVVVSLASEGELDATDARIAVDTLAEARGEPREAAVFDLYRTACASPLLVELPPVASCELQVRLLVLLGVASEASLWKVTDGDVEPFVAVGDGASSRRTRATARAALRRGGLTLLGSRALRSALVRRFSSPCAVVVARVSEPVARADGYLGIMASALTPVFERELLLERSAEREHTLVSAGEQRLMRIGFDLHDGPIQDVLALGADITHLREQVYPFILDTHRERAAGRFDDLLARVVELDRQLRELSRSLESRSIVSRPLGETLHREVDTFAERTGIDARLEIRGDPESLTSAQRIAVYRAIQESLSNVREHSGASTVEIRVRMRRSSIEVRVVDDGHGFEVGRALARAAQRGRLGIVGIGERVRMLGGSFEIDSAPGGPTMLTFALPRVTPDERPWVR